MPNSNCHGVLQPRYMSPLETPLASPLRGVQRGSTTGLQGMERMSLGGELVLVSACLTVSPPITRGQAHTQLVIHFFLQKHEAILASRHGYLFNKQLVTSFVGCQNIMCSRTRDCLRYIMASKLYRMAFSPYACSAYDMK